MTGRQEPSEHALRTELHKRLYLLESGPGSYSGTPAESRGSNLSRRNYRTGLAAASSVGNGAKVIGMENGTTCASNGTVTGGTTAGNGTSTGVSPLDVQAAINGGVTVANPPNSNNSLGLNIE